MPKAAAEEKPWKPTIAPSNRKKLSFKDKHALETLPKDIAVLQAKLAKLRHVLDDGNLYAQNPALFDKTSLAIAEGETQIGKMEEQWLALEVLREELEA